MPVTETEARDTVVLRAQLKPADVKRLRARAVREGVTAPQLVGQFVRDGLKSKSK